MDRLSVLVLFGGMSEEHGVSIKSARELARALNRDQYRLIFIYLTRGGEWRRVNSPDGDLETGARAVLRVDQSAPGLLTEKGNGWECEQVDVAFPVLHGRYGEDGAMQGLLELSGIPYVGCGVSASALGMDKALTYLAAQRAGVRTPRFWVIRAEEDVSDGEWRYPVFVKPARSGSSFGVNKVSRREDLSAAVRAARAFDGKVLIEEAVAGVEIGCAVLGQGDAITVGALDQIELSGGFFRIHQEKSPETGSENASIRVPAAVSREAGARAVSAAKAVYRALDCRGLARVDMFLTPGGEIVLNEVNTMPGLTSYSRYPRMMRAAGISMEALVDALIGFAMQK